MSNRLPTDIKTTIFKKLTFKPLSEINWNDFEDLFGERGACGGCWCMYWRLKRKEYEMSKGTGNKKKMKRMVSDGKQIGVLMYLDKVAAGWCSVSPRESFPLLESSRVLKRIDDNPVWSIVCFFIRKEFRRRGLTRPFIQYVIDYARNEGAKILEAYPLDVPSKSYPVVFAHVGFYSAFLKAGFKEVARRSDTRPVMRFNL